MDEKQKGCLTMLLWTLLAGVGLYVFLLVTSNNLYKEQTSLLNTGTPGEATIERVTHPGIWEWGKLYARLEYTVDGQEYATDVPISVRTYQFPTGKVKDGKTLIPIFYNEEDPAKVGFEDAAKTAKQARTFAIVLVCITGLMALFLMFGLLIMRLSA